MDIVDRLESPANANWQRFGALLAEARDAIKTLRIANADLTSRLELAGAIGPTVADCDSPLGNESQLAESVAKVATLPKSSPAKPRRNCNTKGRSRKVYVLIRENPALASNGVKLWFDWSFKKSDAERNFRAERLNTSPKHKLWFVTMDVPMTANSATVLSYLKTNAKLLRQNNQPVYGSQGLPGCSSFEDLEDADSE
jgi:hypothetical protein